MAENNDGISGGLEGTTLPLAMTLSAFTAIAWYNVIDLNVLICITFKRRRGLYFYSLLASSWGIAIYALAFLMKFFQVWKNNYVSVAFITIGWYAMVTGQSLVVYSRHHLVVRDKEKFRWVLYMIIIDVFLFHVPTTVLTFGEFIISGLYVYATREILKPGETFQKKRFRRVMRHLILVNILVIMMDITLLGTEYANLYDIQITLKGTLYSIKLLIEFSILNQLRSIVRPSGSSYDHEAHSQSGARDISLHTFTTHNPNTAAQALANGNSSSIYASRQTKSPFHGDVNDNRVMMTTDVIVMTEELKGDYAGAEDQKSSEGLAITTGGGRASRQKEAYSANSSEVEFAGEGF